MGVAFCGFEFKKIGLCTGGFVGLVGRGYCKLSVAYWWQCAMAM